MNTDVSARRRQARGTSAGGQFATEARSEAVVDLGPGPGEGTDLEIVGAPASWGPVLERVASPLRAAGLTGELRATPSEGEVWGAPGTGSWEATGDLESGDVVSVAVVGDRVGVCTWDGAEISADLGQPWAVAEATRQALISAAYARTALDGARKHDPAARVSMSWDARHGMHRLELATARGTATVDLSSLPEVTFDDGEESCYTADGEHAPRLGHVLGATGNETQRAEVGLRWIDSVHEAPDLDQDVAALYRGWARQPDQRAPGFEPTTLGRDQTREWLADAARGRGMARERDAGGPGPTWFSPGGVPLTGHTIAQVDTEALALAYASETDPGAPLPRLDPATELAWNYGYLNPRTDHQSKDETR